ncbi:nicotinate-nucleotide adenylyltransferase [Alteromonas gilva]|uniref:Probable nicotinate-nucleotide adenylyltransferase n=1 Tax=Alteromonas gilva TaxID=2987522 RepID=A0ABT5L1H5_9ALTE|nr:nicotinate-nucleotide adenylyltransferase [Alteromonas gilva]MDC8830898.1 nicotinate-nucleotide adenylyltransferase [Alteromonas gilva]
MPALLGGTYNPPHRGHINAGLDAISEIGVDRLGLLPCKIPPHKAAPETSSTHRLKMLELACTDDPRLYVEPLELSLPAPSYTVKTLRQIRANQPDTNLFFLLGEDSLYNLPTWYEWQSLTDYCHIIVMRRPGAPGSLSQPLQEWLAERRCSNTEQLHAQSSGLVYSTASQDYPVSSTRLRERIATDINDNDVTYWLNPAVLHYIKQHHLYGTQ